jgi:hypothetical protein
VLHGAGTKTESFKSFVLLNQCILKSDGVLIEDRRSFNTEVVNYGGGFLA